MTRTKMGTNVACKPQKQQALMAWGQVVREGFRRRDIIAETQGKSKKE